MLTTHKIDRKKEMQDIINPTLELVITMLRLDDSPSSDGTHLTNKQRLSLLETVWKNIPYEVFNEILKKVGKIT